MYKRLAILLALPLAGCWHPGPGEVDPTRYPWDQRWLKHPPIPPHPPLRAVGAIAPSPTPLAAPPAIDGQAPGTYCVVALEPGANSGITINGGAMMSACSAPANLPPPKPEN
jgi:hypothetical protein